MFATVLADINMGRGAIIIGLAAVIIGEAIFGKIFRNFGLKLLSVAFGAIIYYIVLQCRYLPHIQVTISNNLYLTSISTSN